MLAAMLAALAAVLSACDRERDYPAAQPNVRSQPTEATGPPHRPPAPVPAEQQPRGTTPEPSREAEQRVGPEARE